MFFVFNPISLIICMITSIILFFFLRQDKLSFKSNSLFNILTIFILNIVIGLLGWLQISILFEILMNPSVDNYSSPIILLSFPIWTGVLTYAISSKVR